MKLLKGRVKLVTKMLCVESDNLLRAGTAP